MKIILLKKFKFSTATFNILYVVSILSVFKILKFTRNAKEDMLFVYGKIDFFLSYMPY